MNTKPEISETEYFRLELIPSKAAVQAANFAKYAKRVWFILAAVAAGVAWYLFWCWALRAIFYGGLR